MGFLTYHLKFRSQKIDENESSTGAHVGDVEAIIKCDTPEAPAQVYCEYVAMRLGTLLGLNIAAGVLVPHRTGLMYASMSISQVANPLEVVAYENLALFRKYHPVEAARLAVFDLWIANPDRVGNVLASLRGTTDDIVAAIDSGSCLLNAEDSKRESLELLWSEDQPDYHAFGAGLPWNYCEETIERIENLSDLAIDDACVLGDTVGSVMLPEQAEVAEVLKWRRSEGRLRRLVRLALKPK